MIIFCGTPIAKRKAMYYETQDSSMQDKAVCPFYGKDDDFCDVGCGYISPHDVNMIIRYCSKRYSECAKYLELSDRYPNGLMLAAAA
jgi:hypothetical protein